MVQGYCVRLSLICPPPICTVHPQPLTPCSLQITDWDCTEWASGWSHTLLHLLKKSPPFSRVKTHEQSLRGGYPPPRSLSGLPWGCSCGVCWLVHPLTQLVGYLRAETSSFLSLSLLSKPGPGLGKQTLNTYLLKKDGGEGRREGGREERTPRPFYLQPQCFLRITQLHGHRSIQPSLAVGVHPWTQDCFSLLSVMEDPESSSLLSSPGILGILGIPRNPLAGWFLLGNRRDRETDSGFFCCC